MFKNVQKYVQICSVSDRSLKRGLSLVFKRLCGYEAHLQNDYGSEPAKLVSFLICVLNGQEITHI